MKFTDLTLAERSMLTMLCTGGSFNTQELGNGCNPRRGPSTATVHLLRMRNAGLVYSNQRAPETRYTEWKASVYGKSVFEGQPNEVVRPAPSVAILSDRVLACLAGCRAKSAGTVARELGSTVREVLEVLEGLRNAGLVSRRPGHGWYLTEAPTKPESGTWVVYHVDFPAEPRSFADEKSAMAFASEMTDKHKSTHYVARLVAIVKPVTQPTHVIERV